MNIRVTDIHAVYEQWRSRGAEFLTPPKDHEQEIRCYMRDPDGYLIEVGQGTGIIDEMASRDKSSSLQPTCDGCRRIVSTRIP
jgi:lactoylglutathione lyase